MARRRFFGRIWRRGRTREAVVTIDVAPDLPTKDETRLRDMIADVLDRRDAMTQRARRRGDRRRVSHPRRHRARALLPSARPRLLDRSGRGARRRERDAARGFAAPAPGGGTGAPGHARPAGGTAAAVVHRARRRREAARRPARRSAAGTSRTTTSSDRSTRSCTSTSPRCSTSACSRCNASPGTRRRRCSRS